MMAYIIMMSYSLLFIVAALVYSHHTKYRKGPGSFCLLFSPVSSQFIYVYGQIKTQIWPAKNDYCRVNVLLDFG